jgi:helicase
MKLSTPEWLDIARTETTAFAAFRCNDPSVTGWTGMVSQAQFILSQLPNAKDTDLLDDRNQTAYEIITASSRIFDLAAQAAAGGLQQDHLSLVLTSIVAFGIAGNFPAATSVIRRNGRLLTELSPFMAAVVATNSPRHLGEMVEHATSCTPVLRYFEALSQFLLSGEDAAMNLVETRFRDLFDKTEDVFTLHLLYLSKATLQQIDQLSFARAMVNVQYRLKRSHVSSILATNLSTLLPPQLRALNEGFLEFDGNKVLSQPTSTGKSFLAELAMASSLQKLGDIAIIITPYVALGRQMARSLESHLPAPCVVHRLFGGYKVPTDSFDNQSYHAVVATPERLDAWLRFNPNFVEQVRCVVADEVHLIERGSRGIRLESLITRFRLVQKRGGKLQIVLMSAVTPPDARIRDWMGETTVQFYQDTWKPTARRTAIWRENGELVWFAGTEHPLPPGFSPQTEAGKVRLAWLHRNFYSSSNIGANLKQVPLAMENVAYLTEHIWNQFREPILCICGSRNSTRQLAAYISKRFQPSPTGEAPGPIVGRAIQAIKEKYPYLTILADCLRSGAAYHNGSLPHDIRELIEQAVLQQELKCVAATTTLAEGVDLPFRVTILVDWLLYGRGGVSPISSKLFKNIAGRCGRAGQHTEGDVILFDNPVGDERYTKSYFRQQIQRGILFGDQNAPLGSALKDASLDPSVVACLESQFLAAIQENPASVDITQEFADSLLDGGGRQIGSDVTQLLQATETFLLGGNGHAFAERNSPLQLTNFGAIANKTGFCPRSCLRIVDALTDLGADLSAEVLLSNLLLRLVDLAEQPVSKFTESLSKPKSRYCVKKEEVSQILEKWVQDVPLQKIFAELPHWTSSKRSVPLDDWLQGRAGFSTWDGQFDDFTTFCVELIGKFLPWLLRACAMLSPFGNVYAQTLEWNGFADQIDKIPSD